ncbi:MAG: CPBP family intramembrane metalloprotease [Thermogutta sp.]|uniref:CPBP family intramembrane glutamic endopeptidase n=1 Tax=Thermogutta sp. TaxID=1962930 RepID=UPI0019AFF268|nr:CPBP family intramembrane glutamic endopeptidase [Thermogutta sp.]MBC7351365.1 CPBP family intramembrane metalloprotease [Thermogutta sp.]
MDIRNPDQPVADSRAVTAQLIVYGTLLECAIGLVAVVAGWVLRLPLWEVVRWDFSALGAGALATLPMLLLLPVVRYMPGRVFKELRALMTQMIAPLFRSATIGEMAMISCVAGIGEEAFFRGIVQRGLATLLGTPNTLALADPATILAILAAAILFGLAHPLSKIYVVLTTILGVYLGVLFAVSGNLLVPMVAHGLYDFVAVLYLARFWPGNRAVQEQQDQTE